MQNIMKADRFDDHLLIEMGHERVKQENSKNEDLLPHSSISNYEIEKLIKEHPECAILRDMLYHLRKIIAKHNLDKTRENDTLHAQIEKLEAIERSLTAENKRLRSENAALKSK